MLQGVRNAHPKISEEETWAIAQKVYSQLDDEFHFDKNTVFNYLIKLDKSDFSKTLDDQCYTRMDSQIFDDSGENDEIYNIKKLTTDQIFEQLEKMESATTSHEFASEYIHLRGDILTKLMAEKKHAKHLAESFFRIANASENHLINSEKLYLADEQGNRIDYNSTDNLLTFQIQLFQSLASGVLESYASEIGRNIANEEKNDPRVKRADALLRAMNSKGKFAPFKLNLISRETVDKHIAEVKKGHLSKQSILDNFDSEVGNVITSDLLERLDIAISHDPRESPEIPDLVRTWIINTVQEARDRIKSAQPALSAGVNTVNASLPT
jgi:hypothetical protein